MAETRGIARALRFAGYGVEHCSAEEISHLENGNGNGAQSPAKKNEPEPEPPRGKVEIGFQPIDDNVYKPKFKVIDNPAPGKESEPNNGDKPRSGGNGNGNGSKQMTQKQFEYIRSMGRKVGLNLEMLSQKARPCFM
jgi:hypothetical protein